MDSFTPVASLIGGMLIGLAAIGLLLFHGRIAGISGIAGGVIRAEPGDAAWRIMFLLGLVATGMIGTLVAPDAYAFTIDRSTSALIVAGTLVGIGTQRSALALVRPFFLVLPWWCRWRSIEGPPSRGQRAPGRARSSTDRPRRTRSHGSFCATPEQPRSACGAPALLGVHPQRELPR
ncbi:MAG: hypothetical protein AAF500_06840 [Myxococcota bacterium]